MPPKLLLVLALLVFPLVPTFWAILDVPKRRFSTDRKKILWFFLVASFPFVGAVFYIVFVRRHTQPL